MLVHITVLRNRALVFCSNTLAILHELKTANEEVASNNKKIRQNIHSPLYKQMPRCMKYIVISFPCIHR